MSNTITDDELEIFIGKKSDYYLKKFKDISGGAVPSNYAAFLLSGPWLLYRKMYLFGTIFFAAIIIESFMSDIIFVDILGKRYSSNLFDGTLKLMNFMICGLYGTRLYLWHAKRKISELQQKQLTSDLQTDAIKQKGGVSWVAAILGSILLFLVMVSILAIIKVIREGKF